MTNATRHWLNWRSEGKIPQTIRLNIFRGMHNQTDGERPLILTFSPGGGEGILLALSGLENESNEVFYKAD